MINIDKEQAKNIEVPEMKENTKEAKPDKIVLRKDPVQIKAPTKKQPKESETQTSTTASASVVPNLTRANTISTMMGSSGQAHNLKRTQKTAAP